MEVDPKARIDIEDIKIRNDETDKRVDQNFNMIMELSEDIEALASLIEKLSSIIGEKEPSTSE